MSDVTEIAKKAKIASINALKLSSDIKNQALTNIANSLEKRKEEILTANIEDINIANGLLNENKISNSMFNRLKLDENKLRDMIQGVRDVINLNDPVNKILWSKDIADGITLKKVTCPIGVIGIIFEARPDVISQITALSVKSSNAVKSNGRFS